MVKRTTEEKENPTEDDIRPKLKTLSPLLAQEYLENLLKRISLPSNIRVFASKNLAELYAKKGLWSNAARIMESAADVATNFNDKRDLFMNTAILNIRAGDYMVADDAFRKAMDAATPGEKAKIQNEARNLMLQEATSLESEGKMSKAVKIYERMLRSTISNDEKKKCMVRLVPLYEKLARISDSIAMRNSLKAM